MKPLRRLLVPDKVCSAITTGLPEKIRGGDFGLIQYDVEGLIMKFILLLAIPF